MRVELIRHGQTLSNLERRYLGLRDEPLSPQGKEGLAKAGHICGRVYVTTLRRTKETAAILFPDTPCVIAEGLEEMDFGVFDGRTADEMSEDAAYCLWVEGGCTGKCPGGEDKETFCSRIAGSFDALLTGALERGEEEVVLVCHGGTIMAVMERYAATKRDYYSWLRPCGCGYVLEAEGWETDKTLRVTDLSDYRSGI